MTQDEVLTTLLDERPALTGFAWSIVRDFHAAEDIYQETILRATRHVEEFASRDHLLNWSRKVARNLAVDQVRQGQGNRLLLDADVLDKLEHVSATAARTTTDDLRVALSSCLGELAERARQMIKSRYSAGMTVREIAQMLGLRIESAYQAFYRTHQKLGDCIEKRLESEGRRR